MRRLDCCRSSSGLSAFLRCKNAQFTLNLLLETSQLEGNLYLGVINSHFESLGAMMLLHPANVTQHLIVLAEGLSHHNSNNAFIASALIHHDKAILQCMQ